jgi:hypothetical protein
MPQARLSASSLALTDHGPDDVAEKPACGSAVSQFAGPLQVLPDDLERTLKELGERDGHERRTNENRARSMSSLPSWMGTPVCGTKFAGVTTGGLGDNRSVSPWRPIL